MISKRGKMVKIQEESMEELLKNRANFLPFKKGDTAEGTIISKTRNNVWIEIEGRGIGMVPPREIPADIEDIGVGDKVIAFIMEPEDEKGNIILSLKRADREKVWLNLKRKFEQQEQLAVRVVEANKGGLMVEVSGIRGFLPLSQLSSQNYPKVGGDKSKILDKLSQLIGQKMEVKIIGFDQAANKLIFSEKKVSSIIEKEKIKDLKVGEKVNGTISGVVDFGLFIRFSLPSDKTQEYEGLVHISEISWSKVQNIKKEYQIGDPIKAEVISIDDGRVSLSIKRLLPDPWIKKIKKYKIGSKVVGKITRVTPFGAFVELEKDIEGLVHISEISSVDVSDPWEILKEGDRKKFEIISLEPANHKIGLRLNADKDKKKVAKKK